MDGYRLEEVKLPWMEEEDGRQSHKARVADEMEDLEGGRGVVTDAAGGESRVVVYVWVERDW